MANEKRLIDANACPCIKCDRLGNCRPGLCDAFAEWWLSPVDAVEVKHGRWEVIEASDELYSCSACGEWQFIPEEHFAYCPYCGAKMDGGTDDGLL